MEQDLQEDVGKLGADTVVRSGGDGLSELGNLFA